MHSSQCYLNKTCPVIYMYTCSYSRVKIEKTAYQRLLFSDRIPSSFGMADRGAEIKTDSGGMPETYALIALGMRHILNPAACRKPMYACKGMRYLVNKVHVCQSSARTLLCHTEEQFYFVRHREIFPELCRSPAENSLSYFDSYCSAWCK